MNSNVSFQFYGYGRKDNRKAVGTNSIIMEECGLLILFFGGAMRGLFSYDLKGHGSGIYKIAVK